MCYLGIRFELILRNQQNSYKLLTMDQETQLLKQYISTLEQQNNARNQQRNTLYAQIDKLTAQLAHLDGLLQNKTKGTTDPALQDKLKKCQQTVASLTKQISSLNAKIIQLTSQNSALRNISSSGQTEQIVRLENTVALVTSEHSRKEEIIKQLKQDKVDLQRQIDALRSSNYESSLSKNQVTTLERQLATYKSKVSELTQQQSYSQSSSIKVTQLENSKRSLQSQLSILEAKCQKLQIDNKKLDIENKQLKMNNRSPSEMTTLMNSKLTLESTIRQLTSKVEWAEGTNKNLEREKKQQERRITELEKELYESKGRLTQLRFNEQSYRKTEAEMSIRQKEMQALENMISNLKDNKRLLQKTIKQKEDIIISLESQVYTFRTSSHNHSDLQRQINDLRSSKNACQRQVGTLTRTNQELTYETNHLKSQISTLNVQLNVLREQRDTMARERSGWLRQKDQRSLIPQDSSQLRWQVQRLRMEVDELKSGNMYQSEVHNYDTHQQNCRSHVHLHQKMRPSHSPVKDSYNKGHSRLVVAEKDKGGVNRQKWQNLQRKISALRSQNQTLKHSLFQ